MGADCRPAKVMILGDRFDRDGSFINYGDFAGGLRQLLQSDLWRERGRAGAAHVAATYELSRAVDQHCSVYETLMGRPARPVDRGT